eukprot:CAMPEP_0196754538 /NCGR_PEP_ID=MMETSP1091-20130531/94284_1 /TAXON_ID=302021 /ORGANISM="Rhodomonas sp., Strain CCMP768" /LENGTH=78 /DNA_ID=CAMNT_0042102817 /DNA_START=5 /DNA_END=239 /DNA_ORIENTATION=-
MTLPNAEDELRILVALLRGLGPQLDRLPVVLGQTLALVVAHAERELGVGVALLGGPSEPPRSLRLVLAHALPLLVADG